MMRSTCPVCAKDVAVTIHRRLWWHTRGIARCPGSGTAVVL